MNIRRISSVSIFAFFLLSVFSAGSLAETDVEEKTPLLSWKDADAKQAILEYIENISSPDSKDVIPEQDRIAVFEDKGTLWPARVDFRRPFLMKRVEVIAEREPGIASQDPFRSILRGGMPYMKGLDDDAVYELGKKIRDIMGEEQYYARAKEFFDTSKQPDTDIAYKDLVYKPMRDLIAYLRAKGFKVFIASIGDITLTKSISWEAFSVQPRQVIPAKEYSKLFSSGDMRVRESGRKLTDEEMQEEEEKKLYRYPVFAAGSVSGKTDLSLLEYTRKNTYNTMQMLVVHDDDRESRYLKDHRAALEEAGRRGWLLVSVKRDWKDVFVYAPEKQKTRTRADVPAAGTGSHEREADQSLTGGITSISRPSPEEGPTRVNVAIFLADIDEINTVKQNFTANLFAIFQWYDPRLSHEGAGILKRRLQDVWHPQVQLLNQQRLWYTFPDIVEVKSSGEVIYRQRVWGSFSQPLDLKDFPFDKQLLSFQFVVAGSTPAELELLKSEFGFHLAESFSVPDWNVVSWEYTTAPFRVMEEGPAVSSLTFSLKMARKSWYYIFQVVIPLILIVIMSWAVFWIDPKETGVNITASLTAFLTLVAYRFTISAFLPELSYFTRLDAFVFASTFMVFASLIQTIINANLIYAGKRDLVLKIEHVSRVVYPAIFGAIIYFSLIHGV